MKITYEGFTYTCSAGETFDGIALDIYGDEKYAADLVRANPLYGFTVFFSGGEVLALPVVDVPEDEDETDFQVSIAPWKE